MEAQASLLLKNKENIADEMGASAFLELIYVLSISFASFTIIMIVYLLLNRIIQNKRKDRNFALRKKYQEYLADFISIPMQDELKSIGISTSVKGLSREDISKKRNRVLLLDEIYELHQQLSGYQAEMLKHLFWGWSMHEDAIIGLRHNSPHTVTRAIDIVSEFGIKDQLEAVRKLVNSKHIDVRSQAMACVISMTDGDLSFLKDINHELTDWEKHKVLFAIQNVDGREHIDFDELILIIPRHTDFIHEIRKTVKPQLQHYLQWADEIIN